MQGTPSEKSSRVVVLFCFVLCLLHERFPLKVLKNSKTTFRLKVVVSFLINVSSISVHIPFLKFFFSLYFLRPPRLGVAWKQGRGPGPSWACSRSLCRKQAFQNPHTVWEAGPAVRTWWGVVN